MKIHLLFVTMLVAWAFLLIPQSPKEQETISRSAPLSIEDIERIIDEAAVRHGIDRQKFLAVAKCESSLRPGVIGDDGNSVGLFQIHLPSHPDVTEELARATEWAA